VIVYVGRLSIFRRSPSLSAALGGRHAAGHLPESVTRRTARRVRSLPT